MLRAPILFGHRGARGHAQENTLESFELALRLGATGLETDAWITRDGTVVLDHDGSFGTRFKRREIKDVDARDLPSHIPTLAEMCELLDGVHVSIDIKDPHAFSPTCDTLLRSECPPDRVWLCHPDLEIVRSWRPHTHFNLVHSTRYSKIAPQFETHAATLSNIGINAFNMPASEWSGGLIALYHRFSIDCFAWNVQYAEVAKPLVNAGIDALYGDYVDRLVDAVRVD